MILANDLHKALKERVEKEFPNRGYNPVEWKERDHFQLWTSWGTSEHGIHYEYYVPDDEVQLHFEDGDDEGKGNFTGDEYRFLRESLLEATKGIKGLKWDTWPPDKPKKGKNCRCRYDVKVSSADKSVEEIADSIIAGFKYLIEKFDNLIIKIIRNKAMEEYIKLLKSNHNLILTGAPGTGKTYLAKQIAKAMGAETEFVQFHPSYDYTDFVEGLRPMEDENGDIGFERKDGIFKSFCKKALQNFLDSKKSAEELNAEDNFRTAYENFTGNVAEGKETKINLKRGGYREIVGLSINNNILLKSSGERPLIISFDRLKKLSEVYKKTEELDNIDNINTAVRDVIGGCDGSAYWATLQHIYKGYYNKETTTKKSKVEEKKFVFIIDEINRGDVSKILGELFFSIDPGYRGEKGKVKTQYHNLLENSGDVFEDGFYVPENVYIIGTMNDIDRSVESMDFAMRRRFAWKEITAEDQMDMLDDLLNDKEKAKNRLLNLNNAIEKIEGLSAAYHIGPAYFLKLKMYKDAGAWNSLWENHIEGVLREYLRGNEDIDKHMKKLKEAYNNDQPQNREGEESKEVTENKE